MENGEGDGRSAGRLRVAAWPRVVFACCFLLPSPLSTRLFTDTSTGPRDDAPPNRPRPRGGRGRRVARAVRAAGARFHPPKSPRVMVMPSDTQVLVSGRK